MDIDDYHQEGHNPPTHPILFPVEPEFDQDRLDEEYRRNYQLGIEAGYTVEDTFEEEDPAVIDANYQAWASSEEGQLARREEEQQEHLEEALLAESLFFRNAPTSHSSHSVLAQPSYTSRFIPQKTVLPEQKPAPEHQVEPVKLPTHTEKAPTPYDVVQWLINSFSLVHAGGTMYVFDGEYYAPRQAAEVDRYIMEHCREAVRKAGKEVYVCQVRKMLLLEPKIRRDTNLYCNVVAFDDCLFDLEKWETRPHDPRVFVTTRLRASFEKGRQGDCPVFQQLLEAVSGGDSVLQQRIWECLGYLLVPDQAGKCFVLFQGVPNSGKSVIGTFLRECFPKADVSALELNDLGGRFDMADLVGKKFCADLDLPSNPFKPRAVSNLKKLTGGDMLSTDVKFMSRTSFCCTTKVLFGTNHAVSLPKDDPAFMNRIVVVPFSLSVDKEHQDHTLPESLARERDAIVVRALEAYRELRERNYVFSGEFCLNEVIDGEALAGKLVAFQKECCNLEDGSWVATDQLYTTFVALYGDCCSKNVFSAQLFQLTQTQKLPIQRTRNRLTPSGNPVWGFKGLKLKEETYE